MRKALFLPLFYFLVASSSYAGEYKLTHFIVPPAHPINWGSEYSLITSFLKSFSKALLYSGEDTSRKAIGHVVTRIKCDDVERWTSISIDSINMLPNMLSSGVNGLFRPIKGAIVQDQINILKFLFDNRENAKFMSYEINIKKCKALIQLDDNLREIADAGNLYFGPTLENILIGGTGASYSVSMLREVGIVKNEDILEWKQFYTSNNNTYEFYDSYKTWIYIHHHSLDHQITTETLSYRNRLFRLEGLLIE